MLEPGSLVGGKYRLERPLGAGGMGAVWVARHTHLDVEMALKVMGPQVAAVPDARTRFVREAKAAAQLKSPYIVQVHDFGGIDEEPYLAMELLDGEDLGAFIARERQVPLLRTFEIVSQVAKALRVAHEARIVHRDLKPTNIFLARVGGEEVVKVLDFGIAKVLAGEGQSDTTSGSIIGSPAYMSPEQARGAPLDERSDLWSLGAVVFEMVTGRQAFSAATIGDAIMKICSDRLPVATEVAPWLPIEIDAFFERVFERNPSGRFPSARAFADAFEVVARAAKGSAPALALARTEPRGRTIETQVLPLASEPPASVAMSEPPASASLSGPTIGSVSSNAIPRSSRGRAWMLAPALIGAVIIGFWLLRVSAGPPVVASSLARAAPAPSPVVTPGESLPSSPGSAGVEAAPSAARAAPSSLPAASASAASSSAEALRAGPPRPGDRPRTPGPRPSASAAVPPAPTTPIDPFSGLPVKGAP